jgi:hypothetical protein
VGVGSRTVRAAFITFARKRLILTKAAPTAGPESDSTSGWPGRIEAVDTFLMLLSKAVRQVHAYPIASQVCIDAVSTCRAHLSTIDGPDETKLAVTPDALLLHDKQLGDNAVVRQELTRRLRRARVVELTVHHHASARDLTRFCVNLIRVAESPDRTLSMAALMQEDGVEAVSVEVTARREVMQVAPAAPTQRDLVAHERRRRDDAIAGNMRTAHLFPPHRGWIRLDPAESYNAITLADLAILVDDPNELAAMLQRLVEDGQDARDDSHALERRFGDVAAVFAGLEPRLSLMMFGKLAAAVCALDVEPRHNLLKAAILPAIFDRRPAASVLHAFNDETLAESLCLLTTDTAGPGIAISALDQLGIRDERRLALVALIDDLLRARIDPSLGLDASTAIELDRQARRLTSIDASVRRSFAELSGFELRLDDGARDAIAGVRAGIQATDGLLVELTCLANLIALQPNPEVAGAFVQGTIERASQLVTAGRWRDLAVALDHVVTVVEPLRERRPEVTTLVDDALASFSSPDFAAALMAQHGRGEESQVVSLCIIDALGPAMAPALLTLLETNASAGSVAVGLMSERAALFAPSLADNAAGFTRQARPHVARILGHAGAGYEDAVGSLVTTDDERTAREALRALARIGTPHAAELVNRHARGARGWLLTAIVEAILHFPAETSAVAIRDLLAQRAFVLAHPNEASRLIARAAQAKVPGLEPVLRDLVSLRFRFWNRALVKVAHDAEALLRR